MVVERNVTNKALNVRRKIVYLTGSIFVLVLVVIGAVYGTQHVSQARSISDWLEKEDDPEVKKAVEHMKNADPKYPTLRDAVMAARCADVKSLLIIKENGFTNWQDPEIMLAACKTPFLDIVRTIHQFGGNVNAKEKEEYGFTALMRTAGEKGNLEMVKYLVSNGADIKAKNNKDGTALMWAAKSGNIETVKYLVSNGADIKAKNNKDGTALMWAAKSGNIETVKFLVSNGADIKAKTENGKAALQFAVKKEVSDYLLFCELFFEINGSNPGRD